MTMNNSYFSQRFFTVSTDPITEHEKEVRLLRYLSTQMTTPSKIRKVDNKEVIKPLRIYENNYIIVGKKGIFESHERILAKFRNI